MIDRMKSRDGDVARLLCEKLRRSTSDGNGFAPLGSGGLRVMVPFRMKARSNLLETSWSPWVVGFQPHTRSNCLNKPTNSRNDDCNRLALRWATLSEFGIPAQRRN